MENTAIWKVKQDLQVSDHTVSIRLGDSLFSKELAPHYMKLAGQLASSEIVPKCYRNKPADLFLCWAKGYQLGIPPEQAMDCISVINGKATMWGDEMLGLCMVHKDFQDIIEEPIIKDSSVFGYKCTVKRAGMEPKTNKFDLNDAKKAGLLGKPGPWSQYAERMLKLRARAFTLRDAFPDALKGIKSREEVEDYIDAEYTAKPSRAEVLKNELKGVSNVDLVYGKAIVPEHSVSIDEDRFTDNQMQEDEGLSAMAQSVQETTELHTKIKHIVKEKRLDKEVLNKSLRFYEVDTIEQLDFEAATDFLNKLNK